MLGEAGFDEAVDALCEPYYTSDEKRGRPSIPPTVYFRMLMVGYFEGLGSQRGIAWRCGDSLSLRKFLGVKLTERAPDHSTLTRAPRPAAPGGPPEGVRASAGDRGGAWPAEGEDDEPTDEDIRRFDKKRKNKKVSNEEWGSLIDPDSCITQMKDGRRHMAYKAEHVIDLETELILAAEVYHAERSDSRTLADTAMAAQTH